MRSAWGRRVRSPYCAENLILSILTVYVVHSGTSVLLQGVLARRCPPGLTRETRVRAPSRPGRLAIARFRIGILALPRAPNTVTDSDTVIILSPVAVPLDYRCTSCSSLESRICLGRRFTLAGHGRGPAPRARPMPESSGACACAHTRGHVARHGAPPLREDICRSRRQVRRQRGREHTPARQGRPPRRPPRRSLPS